MTLHVNNCLKISFQRTFDAVVKKKKNQNFFLLIYVCIIVFTCRAVWAVANGDYVEARAAQALVVQYPFSN